MYKVGILYICTGRYSSFWKDFYLHTEKDFLPDTEKHYFVWTDDKEIIKEAQNSANIKTYRQKTEPWPFPTLKRFEYFLRAEEDLSKMDHLIFMNANLIVMEKILSGEVLPSGDERIFVTLHPGFYNKTPDEFTYDNNPGCAAYIAPGEGQHYFAGGFNGGRTEDYLKMIRFLAGRVEEDLKKKIIALWHDESYLNRYIFDYDKPYRILDPGFLYPEGWDIPFEQKILILDKNKKGGHDYLRGCNGHGFSLDFVKSIIKKLLGRA